MERLFIFRMFKEKNIFIKLLEFGEKSQLNGVYYDELRSWARNENIISDDDSSIETRMLCALFDECFQNARMHGSAKKCVLKMEYYSRLLEYRELQEARKNAREAKFLSLIAITISLITLIITANIDITELTTNIIDNLKIAINGNK